MFWWGLASLSYGSDISYVQGVFCSLTFDTNLLFLEKKHSCFKYIFISRLLVDMSIFKNISIWRTVENVGFSLHKRLD